MAISKIWNMKATSSSDPGRHLKNAIAYILNPIKTSNGLLTGGINCTVETGYEQMVATKTFYNKLDKRQGYHLILSFPPDENVSPEKAYEIVEKFAKEYLGEAYEVIYAVHTDQKHMHGHIIFNSVSFVDGIKYRYNLGDWAKYIQPIANKLCEEYGLSTLKIDDEEIYHKPTPHAFKATTWNKMIIRDIDAAIIQAGTFDEFLTLLKEKGYGIHNDGKYVGVKPPGMNRYRRIKTLGDNYSEAKVRERIAKEDISYYQKEKLKHPPKLNIDKPTKVPYKKRAPLTKYQKRKFAKLYATGKLKNRPYSQIYQYRDDIKQLNKLQDEYWFLQKNKIKSVEDLDDIVKRLDEINKNDGAKRRAAYRKKANFDELFDLLEDYKQLEYCVLLYEDGNKDLRQEYEKAMNIKKEVEKAHYTIEELEKLVDMTDSEIEVANQRYNKSKKNLSLAKDLVAEQYASDSELEVRELKFTKKKNIDR